MIDDELTALRHEVQSLRAQVKQSEYPCSPHCVGYLREIEMRAALREMIYEATHLSPCKDDGSHDCTISAVALANARAALSTPSTLAEIATLNEGESSPCPDEREIAP